MELDALDDPRTISHLSLPDDRICNWTIRASCDHVIEITALQLFNKTESENLFVSKELYDQISVTIKSSLLQTIKLLCFEFPTIIIVLALKA